MSGAWAEACDGWATRVPFLDDTQGEAPVLAVYWLSEALMCRSPRQQREAVEVAGAYLRAWRKNLPHQGQRAFDLKNMRADRLLWTALMNVYRAQFWQDKGGHPDIAANGLRTAESALRTWWKRQQEVQ